MTADRGAVSIVMMMVVAIVVLTSIATAGLGVLLSERERADVAAEAAALAAAVATYPPAAATSPSSAAGSISRENGARLVSCTCPLDPTLRSRQVSVVVSVETEVPIFGVLVIRRMASAEFDPRSWLGV